MLTDSGNNTCLLSSIKLFYTEARDRAIAEDIEASALDLIMEADASVSIYREQFGMLPEDLPDISLRPFVDYSRVNENNYTLRLHLEGYDAVIPVSITQTLSAEGVSIVLRL